MRLAIVIPTLDEETALSERLADARRHADDLVVSDGGSTDRTVQIAEDAGARVVSGPPGRGGQLNRGAAAADGDVLLFLHADTRLPEGAAEAVRAAIRDGAVAGGFLLRFDDERPRMRLAATLINWRTRLTRTPLGDQAQFARREVFERLGGFREWPILEDLDLARRLRREGRMALLERPVETAARRFLQQGAVRTVARNWTIWFLYLLGVSPHRLARLYRHVR